MKKILLLALVVSSLYGCQNLKPINGGSTTPGYNNQLHQEDFFLNESGVAYILDMIDTNMQSDKTRYYEGGKNFPVYVGEYLVVPCGVYGVDKVTAVSTPKTSESEAFVRGNSFYFRSIYQGDYIFNLERNGMVVKTLFVSNRLKYKISESELKTIIYRNYSSKKLSKLVNSVTLYRLAFPADSDNKGISMLVFDLGVVEHDKEVIKVESKFILENFELTDQEKMKVISGAIKILGENYQIPAEELNFANNSIDFNRFLAEIISKKSIKTEEEKSFLGSIYQGPTFNLGDDDDEEAVTPYEPSKNRAYENYEKAMSYYREGSYAEAISLYENVLESNESFDDRNNIPFYLGNAYMKSGNLAKAKENFLLVNSDDENYPEAMYRLGEVYYKTGEKDLAVKRFEENKDAFSGTVWGRKSSIYLLKLK